MRRFFRHIHALLAVSLLLIAGVWLAVPRDICLTKALVDSACSCSAADLAASSCPCCTSAKAGRSLGCGVDHADENEPGTTEHSSSCLLVSSALSKANGAERIQPDAPILDVVAILPVESTEQTLRIYRSDVDTEQNQALNHASVYRDNCVYLI